MATEWEELEKLTNDELIIELVRQRWLYRDLKMVLRDLSGDFGYHAGAPGEIPPEKWQRKIAEYVFPKLEAGSYDDLQEWGVSEEIGEKLYDEYFDENRKWKTLDTEERHGSRRSTNCGRDNNENRF